MVAKPRLFIGCSKEEINIAKLIKSLLEDSFEVYLWDDKIFDGSNVFNINRAFLVDLIASSLKYDFGILIGSPDDKVIKNSDVLLQPRDNVIFELGLFIGRMGLDRVVFMTDSTVKIPSDFMGISRCIYDKDNPASIVKKVGEIKEKFLNHSNTDVNFFPSTVLASVYFESFVKPIINSYIQNQCLECDGINYKEIILKIFIPDKISDDINKQFDVYKFRKNLKSQTIRYSGRNRNYDVEVCLGSDILNIVDLPTVLSGINYSIRELLPHDISTQSKEYKLILARELHKFKTTLQMLISRNDFDAFVEFV